MHCACSSSSTIDTEIASSALSPTNIPPAIDDV
jgi:hypothetical protein